MQLTIEKQIYGGDGLSRLDGEVVLTPFVLAGETVLAEKLPGKQKVQRARVQQVATPSPDRVDPPCPVFGSCGGCQYQHAAYDAQLRFKREILVETLRRGGHIVVHPDDIRLVSAEPFGYRNRVQFHIVEGSLGYLEMNSHRLVPIANCPIASPKINEATAILSRMVRDRQWPRFVSALEIFTDERQVQWNVLESERPVAKRFFEWLAQEVPGSVLGAVEYQVNQDLFQVSGNSFFQVNRFLLPRFAELAIGDFKGNSAWDLYAGVGLFSLPMARRFEMVTAVETGRAAISDLRHNATRAGVALETATEQTEAFLATQTETPDLVLADPPRTGLGKGAITRLVELRPKHLVIVSCDPATLARDLAGLLGHYEVEELILVDLFPQTFHLETIARLTLA